MNVVSFLQIKFRLFEVCSEGTEDVSIISELQNLGVDFNKFTNVSMNTSYMLWS